MANGRHSTPLKCPKALCLPVISFPISLISVLSGKVLPSEAPANWNEALKNQDAEQESSLRTCTYAGKPFAEESFVTAIAEKFGRYWNRGRPRKGKGSKQDKTDSRSIDLASRQFPLF